jgi:hypothetical protein
LNAKRHSLASTLLNFLSSKVDVDMDNHPLLSLLIKILTKRIKL